jgi:hypothetical protein
MCCDFQTHQVKLSLCFTNYALRHEEVWGSGCILTYLLTYGAQPFLRSCQLCTYSRTPQHFMEPEGSLPCSPECMYTSTFFLTSALDGGEWPASRPGRFIPGKRTPSIHWIGGWVGPRTDLDDMEKRKILTLPGFELQPLGRPTRSQSLYRLRYTGCLNKPRLNK